MTAMAMASGAKNHEAMMKNATKVPNNTVFFMDGGLYVHGFRNARPDRQFLSALIRSQGIDIASSEAAPCGRPAAKK
jgi:hypothetical protein